MSLTSRHSMPNPSIMTYDIARATLPGTLRHDHGDHHYSNRPWQHTCMRAGRLSAAARVELDHRYQQSPWPRTEAEAVLVLHVFIHRRPGCDPSTLRPLLSITIQYDTIRYDPLRYVGYGPNTEKGYGVARDRNGTTQSLSDRTSTTPLQA